MQAIDPLLADDYVHVNSTGRVIGKAKFLDSMAGRVRETTRGPLTVNVYGDTAVIFGEQHNRTAKPDGSVSASDASDAEGSGVMQVAPSPQPSPTKWEREPA